MFEVIHEQARVAVSSGVSVSAVAVLQTILELAFVNIPILIGLTAEPITLVVSPSS